jgi:hypothetical protein
MRIFLVLVFSLVTLCSQAQYKALSIKLGGANYSVVSDKFNNLNYDISGSKNLSIDYRSFILRAGNKFHVDLGYVVGLSFAQFNKQDSIVDFDRQRNMNLSAGLSANLPITKKLRLNAAYSIGVLRSSNYYKSYYSGYGISKPASFAIIFRSSSIDYGIDYDLSKNFSLGLSLTLSKIKYDKDSYSPTREIAFRSVRFSYYF